LRGLCPMSAGTDQWGGAGGFFGRFSLMLVTLPAENGSNLRGARMHLADGNQANGERLALKSARLNPPEARCLVTLKSA
jgi:hypothetical protein